MQPTLTPYPSLHPAPPRVFVYGTLRPGHGNHRVAARWNPTATPASLDGFALYDGPGFPYAAVQPGRRIVGDLLEFPADLWPDALADLDSLEGYPHHYGRSLVTVDVASTEVGDRRTAWVYVADPGRVARRQLLEHGDWNLARAARWGV